jgi:predicted Zn-dependent protease
MRVSLAEHLADPTIWRGAATRSDLQSNRQDAHQGPRPRGHSRGHPTGQPGDRRADHPGGSFLKRTLAGALGALLAGAVTLASAAPAAQAQSIIRDEEIENLLRDYTNPILQAAGLQPEDVRIFVLNDPTLNAFVTGGQNIFLHTGLILAADTPNQLKGVIAHETGHIAGGHLVRSQQAMEVAMRPALLSMFLGVLAIAGGAPDAGAALIQNSQYWAALTFFRHTRVQESSADQSAVTYLEETGQSAQGLLDFFDKFRYQEVMSDARREPYFRSHPLSADRMQALRGRVQAQPHQTAADDARSLERFKLAQAKLYGFLEAPQRTFIKYPPSDTSQAARYARAIAAYRIPDTKRAIAEAQALIAAHPENPYYHELLGQILFESGQAAASIYSNRQALALSPQSALFEINLARSLLATETKPNTDQAIKLLKASLARDPDNGFAWREIAVGYERRGETNLAELATAELAFSIGDYPRALQFAKRAQNNGLKQGSPEWRRSADIILISEPQVQEFMRRGGRRSLSEATSPAPAHQGQHSERAPARGGLPVNGS